jgi:hypothetical protein
MKVKHLSELSATYWNCIEEIWRFVFNHFQKISNLKAFCTGQSRILQSVEIHPKRITG